MRFMSHVFHSRYWSSVSHNIYQLELNEAYDVVSVGNPLITQMNQKTVKNKGINTVPQTDQLEYMW